MIRSFDTTRRYGFGDKCGQIIKFMPDKYQCPGKVVFRYDDGIEVELEVEVFRWEAFTIPERRHDENS